MVRLSKIYTKTGDGGSTMLGDGNTVPKHTLRVEAYGTVDEANATLGVAIVALRRDPSESAGDVATSLEMLQHDLFDCGADLCVPVSPNEPAQGDGAKLRIQEARVAAIEALIDRYNQDLAPLDSFVLPGGSEAAATLHVARTVVRRAERLVAALLEAEPDATNPQAMIYLNRLSDLLFVLGRVMNRNGAGDVLWLPGKNREG